MSFVTIVFLYLDFEFWNLIDGGPSRLRRFGMTITT